MDNLVFTFLVVQTFGQCIIFEAAFTLGGPVVGENLENVCVKKENDDEWRAVLVLLVSFTFVIHSSTCRHMFNSAASLSGLQWWDRKHDTQLFTGSRDIIVTHLMEGNIINQRMKRLFLLFVL